MDSSFRPRLPHDFTQCSETHCLSPSSQVQLLRGRLRRRACPVVSYAYHHHSCQILTRVRGSRHKSKAHHVCELGCVNKAFSNTRNRDRHYAKAHGQSQFDFHCGCGKKVLGERRDNYLRHLKSCSPTLKMPYICGRDSHETHDKAEHLAHVQMCKGQVGRKKKNQTRSQTCQE